MFNNFEQQTVLDEGLRGRRINTLYSHLTNAFKAKI